MNESPCRKCGVCCKNLSFLDRIEISLHTKTVMLSQRCKFLHKNACLIYDDRPQFCVDWKCGVFYESR